ncbi:LCP family protein [Demequina litorisediminis]|uniref:LCP family protein n=1 Tax=Demequina litorisediminis TaxID=1849022 RepID=UPI0024E07795|nr:LCP family protein [Demequina litorisediminis]
MTWIATGAAAVLGLVIIGPVTYGALAYASADKADVRDISAADGDSAGDGQSTPTNFAGGEALNIALIGIDSREGDNGEIATDDVSGMRGDTTMVMHISADRARIDVVSIPRDSRVQIADCEFYDGTTEPGWTGKFNEALSSGGRYGDRGEGAACVMKTISELTGVNFNGHFALIDFAGFEDMVDAIGGVPMCITEDMKSSKANLDLEAGAQVLDGEEALAFARARTGTGLGGDGTDLARIERQQELLTNMARKILGMNLLTDVTQAQRLPACRPRLRHARHGTGGPAQHRGPRLQPAQASTPTTSPSTPCRGTTPATTPATCCGPSRTRARCGRPSSPTSPSTSRTTTPPLNPALRPSPRPPRRSPAPPRTPRHPTPPLPRLRPRRCARPKRTFWSPARSSSGVSPERGGQGLARRCR